MTTNIYLYILLEFLGIVVAVVVVIVIVVTVVISHYYHLGSSNIYGLTFEFLPSPKEQLDDLDIPQGMHAMGKKDRQRETHRDVHCNL